MGCDARGGAKRSSLLVSIHAPAWGATWSTSLNWIVWRVSIHAPAWGATRYNRKDITVTMVSIHAPAWGATSRLVVAVSWSMFQSTHPRGVRRYRPGAARHDPGRFNPRTRVGCDFFWRARWCAAWTSFNPRTRVGCDQQPQQRPAQACGFQSTHPRGVRRRAGGKP